ALYWIGWAHAQLEKPADAVPVFLSALERHGDDPHAAEIASILTQLERLAPHLDSAAHADFPLWLQQQKQSALAQNRLTYFSRLNLHLARAAEKSRQPF